MSLYKNPFTSAYPGRPATPSALRMTSVCCTLQTAQRDWLMELGRGNLSNGLRLAIGLAGGPKTVSTYEQARRENPEKFARLDKLAAAGSAMNPPPAVETPAAPDGWDVADTSHE